MKVCFQPNPPPLLLPHCSHAGNANLQCKQRITAASVSCLAGPRRWRSTCHRGPQHWGCRGGQVGGSPLLQVQGPEGQRCNKPSLCDLGRRRWKRRLLGRFFLHSPSANFQSHRQQQGLVFLVELPEPQSLIYFDLPLLRAQKLQSLIYFELHPPCSSRFAGKSV
jgi:hypothetical protein